MIHFWVTANFFENCWKMFTFNPPKYQLDEFSFSKRGWSQKPKHYYYSKKWWHTNINKKKHIFVKSIHSSLRSESKTNEITNKCQLIIFILNSFYETPISSYLIKLCLVIYTKAINYLYLGRLRLWRSSWMKLMCR